MPRCAAATPAGEAAAIRRSSQSRSSGFPASVLAPSRRETRESTSTPAPWSLDLPRGHEPPLPRLRSVGAGARVGEHQRADPLRVRLAEGERGVTAHRQPAHHRPLDPQVIEQRHRVGGQVVHAADLAVGRRLRSSEAGEVGREATARAGERRELRLPHLLGEREGVEQQERLARSRFGVGEPPPAAWVGPIRHPRIVPADRID